MVRLTEGVSNVVGSKDTRRGVVASLVDEMNRDRAASGTAVLADGVDKLPDLGESEGRALREEADTSGSDGSIRLKTQLATDSLELGANTGTNGNTGGGTNADDMLAAVVDGVGVLVSGGEDIVPKLDNAYPGLVHESGEVTETGTTAVDYEYDVS